MMAFFTSVDTATNIPNQKVEALVVVEAARRKERTNGVSISNASTG